MLRVDHSMRPKGVEFPKLGRLILQLFILLAVGSFLQKKSGDASPQPRLDAGQQRAERECQNNARTEATALCRAGSGDRDAHDPKGAVA